MAHLSMTDLGLPEIIPVLTPPYFWLGADAVESWLFMAEAAPHAFWKGEDIVEPHKIRWSNWKDFWPS